MQACAINGTVGIFNYLSTYLEIWSEIHPSGLEKRHNQERTERLFAPDDQGIWEAGGWQGPIAQVEGSNPGLQARLARSE